MSGSFTGTGEITKIFKMACHEIRLKDLRYVCVLNVDVMGKISFFVDKRVKFFCNIIALIPLDHSCRLMFICPCESFSTLENCHPQHQKI
jgi:hypothetical protein